MQNNVTLSMFLFVIMSSVKRILEIFTLQSKSAWKTVYTLQYDEMS